MIRPAARVLLLDAQSRLLLLHARRPSDGYTFWLLPGGGLLRGEDFETAARREAHEETGIAFRLGPCVWFRNHSYEWEGVTHHQYERFFVAHALGSELRASHPDEYVIAHRWWTLEEIEKCREDLAPRALARHLGPILRGELPDPPLDCGL